MKDSEISSEHLLEIIQEMKDVLIDMEGIVERLYKSESFTQEGELDAKCKARIRLLRVRSKDGREIIDRIPY